MEKVGESSKKNKDLISSSVGGRKLGSLVESSKKLLTSSKAAIGRHYRSGSIGDKEVITSTVSGGGGGRVTSGKYGKDVGKTSEFSF